ncbi:glutaminase domain-containing protein [Parabacteroides chinchillae]
MKSKIYSLAVSAILLSACTAPEVTETYTPAAENALRAPAVPLVTIDPYTSVWSFSDNLNEENTRHWTGKNFPLLGGIRVDGKSYRFMGMEDFPVSPVIPTAAGGVWEGLYTEKQPAGDWMAVAYEAKGWKTGKAGFGSEGNPDLSTPWTTDDIWVRRTFDLPGDVSGESLYLQYSHDDNIEVYVNGTLVAVTGNGLDYNLLKEIPAEVVKALKPTGNVIAAHCHNNGGGSYVDLGIVKKEKRDNTFDERAKQTSVCVMPTQTFYTFECGGVQLDVIFTAPFLMDDLDLMTSPFNYITYQVRSLDGQEHDVQVYLEATPQLATNSLDQPVSFERIEKDGMTFLKTGTEEQPLLGKSGDDVRIDWGYLYLAAEQSPRVTMSIDEYYASKGAFMANGKLSGRTEDVSPDMQKQMTVLAYADNLGKVSSNTASGHVMIGYDDIYSIQYFGDNRMAYWKHDGQVDIFKAFADGAKNYADVMKRCNEFDGKMMQDAAAAGGQKYAELCALAYRQVIAAHKLVQDKEGNLLFFSKENFSNGSIGTVDITYPSAPMFLLYNPELLKGMMNPILYYSESGKWTKPFAAHDVGTYPLANGQTYGGDMPVEESGNMLILMAAIAQMEGNADYAAKHWDVLTVWTDYLLKEGLDPANQLCTDDFAGHFAHNTNLSIKAIMGIASYGKLAAMQGKDDVAARYTEAAREMAAKWVAMAADGDHYRLTFDKPGTWSQKYNMIWDRLLGFNIFPAEVAATEMAYYKTHQNKYGLPLDNRADYTKSDWIMWSACLTDTPADFTALVEPIWLYANETTSRVPLSDWHFTSNGSQRGFQARSVVGGYFMRLLHDKAKR